MSDYADWIGRTQTVEDSLCPNVARAASATLLNRDQPFAAGDALPRLWHWFYFLATAPQNQLGDDGHPRRTEASFMPPIPLPRRMFAGARLKFHRPLCVGQPAERETTISNITNKSGSSGQLAFITLDHRLTQAGELCLEEQQDIVYREQGAPISLPEPAELPPLDSAAWSQTIVPDTRLLFRYSSLTFNAHRIHYDRNYVTSEEGYPALVVHGQLTATMLLELVLQHAERPVTAFSFRGKAPLFDGAPVRLVGTVNDNEVELIAQGPDGRTAMQAKAELA
ncbi:FAS1-like dehydratase domain-containing protein [Aeoliella mucimassa]|uniref:FAS1-like dehydratase domain-containing protein n=1 Tax=Aeoliella mucimassa TaxID=2527972 RepID=A0A518AIB6_9BACT|nr:MaoC family dehydratase N-terminal domain-containing protein [Aeoliella mucimassa]QDU54469.1 hypothetical protein Pan181_06510 [Aeoliella mucimassa]